ncbi:MAG: hypothetical protein B6I20_00540 [Bacteroidetes bacterium 4572_117]|nr:MAG: hypothetical protein B6I20_00540 [Bacteroidetes bacterium 4572_117]
MFKKKILWRWLTVLYVISFFHIGLLGQIYEKIKTDTIKVESARQHLKTNVEEEYSMQLAPVDSITELEFEEKFEKTTRNPQRAWWYSAILPGLGQAYNKKHWKIPIIYTLFIGTYYIIDDNNFQYERFKNAYAILEAGGKPPVWAPNADSKRLKSYKDSSRRNRDLTIYIGVLIYFLNIIDATVDASFMDFDISDDLAMSVRPDIGNVAAVNRNVFGLKFVISLNK